MCDGRVEILDDLDKRMKKRAYIRTFMKTYRKKEKRGHELLKAQKVQLENEIRELFQSTGRYVETKSMLPWKDIASALAENKRDALVRNQQLRSRVTSLQAIVQEMHEWAGLHVMRQLEMGPTWRNVYLPASPTSRDVAKEWIAHQLHHQMDRVIQSQPFPHDHEGYHDWDLVYSDDHFNIKQCSQFVWDVPMEAVVTLYHRHVCSALWLDGHQNLGLQSVTEESGHTTLHQLIAPAGEYVNLLSAVYPGKDSCRIVLQQIQNDDCFVAAHRQRNRTAWLDIKRLSPTKTRLRVYSEISQNFTKEGFLSFDVEARRFSVDVAGLSDDMKRIKVRNTMVSRQNTALAMANDNMMKLLTQVKT